MEPDKSQGSERTLRSLKEIASFLGVTVRSVQRWEKAGLPLYRQGSGTRGRVFAYRDELQQWLESGGLRRAEEPDETPHNGLAHETEAQADFPATAHPAEQKRWARYTVAAVLVVTVAAILLVARTGVARFGPCIPYTYTLNNFKLSILDSAERVCWSKQLARFDKRYETEVRDKVVIADIDGDGRNEVLFNYLPERTSGTRGSLLCFEAGGQKRWEFFYGEEKTFGNRYFEPFYKGSLLIPARVDGKPVVITAANHEVWYPAQVALLDARSGRKLEEYWHSGSIYWAHLQDVEGDGAEELVFAAINNPGDGLGHTAVGVLKLPFSRAPRQQFADNDPLRPLTEGGELEYVLLPLPDVTKAAAMLPIPYEMHLAGPNRIFVETPLPEGGGAVYYLDSRLDVREFHVSDTFEMLHERYFRQKLVDHQLTAAELAAMGKPIHFRAAPNGNSPEVNRLWKY